MSSVDKGMHKQQQESLPEIDNGEVNHQQKSGILPDNIAPWQYPRTGIAAPLPQIPERINGLYQKYPAVAGAYFA